MATDRPARGMRPTLYGPLVCPELVGRERELEQLVAVLNEAVAGSSRHALVVGEAGVGKSRLLQELLATPDAAECPQVRAACLESDLAEPYALVLELVHAAGGSDRDLPLGKAPEAVRHVRRVQQALREVLDRAANGRPLILVAEDLHWSDASSLEVLLALAQRPGRVFLALSYRSQSRSPMLANFLAELSRLRQVEEIQLGPLRRAEVARVIQRTLGWEGALPGGLLDEVLAATDGLPFLVEEVLRTLVASGALERVGTSWHWRAEVPLEVPGSLQQAVEARLLALPAEVARVAELAAVLGQVVEVKLLHRLATGSEESLLAALRTLAEAQILERRTDGELAFRHALTREAVLTRLLDAERARLHRRAAEALADDPNATPAVLAHHWSRTGELARASPHAVQAGERAAALHAHREAIAYYELALAGDAGPRAVLLAALGDQYAALGEIAEAVSRYRQAQAFWATEREPAQVAELDLRIGLAYAEDRERSRARAHLASAFGALPPDHGRRWLAGLHLALQLAATGDHAAAETTLHQALEAAGHADALARLRVAYEWGGLRARRGDWPALDRAGAMALAQVGEDSDQALALRHDAHAALGTVAYYRGTFERAEEHFRACLGIAERRGLVADQGLAHWNLGTNALYNMGRWPEAKGELAEMLGLGSGPPAEMVALFELWLEGEWERAAGRGLRIWSDILTTGDLELQGAFGRRLADLLLALGRAREALELLEPAVARLRAAEARSFELQLAPREAEALARLGDPSAAEVCEQGLALARSLGGRPAEGLLLRARGLVRRGAGRWAEAFADFDAAVELLSALPMPYEAARTLREAGLARLARGRKGDRERGAESLRSAQRIFADVGAPRDEAATSGILSAAGLARRAERGPGPLSVREREVAELVAQGLSNHQIAERLFVAEKTAAYHVGSIMNKLGFTSRAQIASYVSRAEAERLRAETGGT